MSMFVELYNGTLDIQRLNYAHVTLIPRKRRGREYMIIHLLAY